MVYYTVCGFLFENLFVCCSWKVLLSNRPMLGNELTCNITGRGVT